MSDAFEKYQREIEMQIHQIWVPHSGQVDILKAFFIDWITGVFLQCGRKMGKTELAIYILYMFGILFEGAECYFVADEKDHARKILWDNGRLPRFFTSFKQRVAIGESMDEFKRRREIGHKLQDKWIVGVNNSEMKTKLWNGSIIFVDGAKNYSTADGLSPTIIVYDEFKHHDSRFDLAMRPNMKTFKGRILCMGTPPDNEDNYYCQTAEEFKVKKNHIWIRRPSWMNPHVYDGKDDEDLAEEKRIYKLKGEEHVYLREYEAIIAPDAKSMIFPMIDKDVHMGEHEVMKKIITHRVKDWDFYISFDPGSVRCFAVLFIAINRYDKRVWLIDELYETEQANTTAKNMWQEAQKKWRNWPVAIDDWYMMYDHAATWFCNEIAQEFNFGLIPCEKNIGKKKEAKLSVIKDAMLFDRFLVSDSCPMTWKEMRNYKKDEHGRIPKVDDHNIDNLRYILNAAYYDSVPREPIDPKLAYNNRRKIKLEEDHFERNTAEQILGGHHNDD